MNFAHEILSLRPAGAEVCVAFPPKDDICAQDRRRLFRLI
jgi:hypothetical protein